MLDIREPAYAEQKQTGTATTRSAGGSSATPTTYQEGTVGPRKQSGGGGIVADGRFQQGDVGESPDSISLAFPPLPLAFQQGEMMGGAGGAFDPMGGAAMANAQAFASPTGQSSYAAFEDFRSIFNDEFQQDLRVSTYSNLQDMGQQGPFGGLG